MLLHRVRTLWAYFLGLVFCGWAFIFCRSFKAHGLLRCYSWPNLRSADGEILIGRGVCLGRVKIILANGGCLTLEDEVDINDGVVLGVLSAITIGKKTAIAENVMIRDHDHDYSNVAIGEHSDGYIVRNVTIGKGCWLGFGSIVLKGVEIGDGVIVGAGSVITKNVGMGDIVVGNPAKVIRTRCEKQ